MKEGRNKMNQQKRNWKRKLISAALAVCLAASLSVCTFAETPTMNIQQNAEYTVTEAQIIDGVVFDPGEKILVITQDNSTYSPADSDGTMPILSTPSGGTWKQDNTGWWFQYPNGTYPKDKWEVIDNYWYYFKADGYMATGNITYQANWYYLTEVASPDHPLGSMYMNAWKKGTGTNWYYYGDTGAMLINKWVKTDGKYYFVGKSGAMLTKQWVTTDDKEYYYVDANGVWDENDEKFTIKRCSEGYFDKDCLKFTGKISNVDYYLNSNLRESDHSIISQSTSVWANASSKIGFQVSKNTNSSLHFRTLINDDPKVLAETDPKEGLFTKNWKSGFININPKSNYYSLATPFQVNVISHEIGHFFGAGHTPFIDDLLYPFYSDEYNKTVKKPSHEQLGVINHLY